MENRYISDRTLISYSFGSRYFHNKIKHNPKLPLACHPLACQILELLDSTPLISVTLAYSIPTLVSEQSKNMLYIRSIWTDFFLNLLEIVSLSPLLYARHLHNLIKFNLSKKKNYPSLRSLQFSPEFQVEFYCTFQNNWMTCFGKELAIHHWSQSGC